MHFKVVSSFQVTRNRIRNYRAENMDHFLWKRTCNSEFRAKNPEGQAKSHGNFLLGNRTGSILGTSDMPV